MIKKFSKYIDFISNIDLTIQKYGLKRFLAMANISNQALKRIINGEGKAINIKTIKGLYNAMGLDYDEFYRANLRAWSPQTGSKPGNYLRNKRIELNLTAYEFAKKSNCEKRSVIRFELGDCKYGTFGHNLPYYIRGLELKEDEIKEFLYLIYITYFDNE